MKKGRLLAEMQETARGLARIGVLDKSTLGEIESLTSRTKFCRGSGSAFMDLGFTPLESKLLVLRAQLMSRIRQLASDITQAEAAKRFGVTQPRLNDLLRGKIDKFSLDALVLMLAHAGMHVELRVKAA